MDGPKGGWFLWLTLGASMAASSKSAHGGEARMVTLEPGWNLVAQVPDCHHRSAQASSAASTGATELHSALSKGAPLEIALKHASNVVWVAHWGPTGPLAWWPLESSSAFIPAQQTPSPGAQPTAAKLTRWDSLWPEQEGQNVAHVYWVLADERQEISVPCVLDGALFRLAPGARWNAQDQSYSASSATDVKPLPEENRKTPTRTVDQSTTTPLSVQRASELDGTFQSMPLTVGMVDENYARALALRNGRYNAATGAQREFLPDLNNPDSAKLAEYERVWVYTLGIGLAQAARRGEENAAMLAEWLCQHAVRDLRDPRVILGWHFSHNTAGDDWKDFRLVTGATAWAVHGLGIYAQQQGTALSWVTECYQASLRGLLRAQTQSGLFTAGYKGPSRSHRLASTSGSPG